MDKGSDRLLAGGGLLPAVEEHNLDQTRPDQTTPDQTRPEQNRTEQNRIEYLPIPWCKFPLTVAEPSLCVVLSPVVVGKVL